jgi:hypothetical protein
VMRELVERRQYPAPIEEQDHDHQPR